MFSLVPVWSYLQNIRWFIKDILLRVISFNIRSYLPYNIKVSISVPSTSKPDNQLSSDSPKQRFNEYVIIGSFRECVQRGCDLVNEMTSMSDNRASSKSPISLVISDEDCAKLASLEQWDQIVIQNKVNLYALNEGNIKLEALSEIYPTVENCLMPEHVEDKFLTANWFPVEFVELRSVFEIILLPNCIQNKWKQFQAKLQLVCSDECRIESPKDWTALQQDLYAVRYQDEWHRAKYVKGNESYLIDKGITIEVNQIIRVSPGVLNRYPAMARDCMLDRVEPLSTETGNENWSDEANEILRKLILKNQSSLMCRCSRVVPFDGVDVCLIELKSETCSDLSKAFVETGFAQSF